MCPHSLGKLIKGQFSLRVLNKKPSELTKALRVVIRVHLLISLSAATDTLSGVISDECLLSVYLCPHSPWKLVKGQFSLRVLNKKPSELTKALGVVIRVHLLVSLSAATETLSGVITERF
jgi:hypothetical protein